MAAIQTPIPNLPFKAGMRKVPWTYLLIASAALLLTACGGSDEASPGASAGAVRNVAVLEKSSERDPADCWSQVNDTPEKLLACVTLSGVREHQQELVNIAKANNGTRQAGTPGYDASVEYARKVFEKAGFTVTLQPFEFPYFEAKSSKLQLAWDPKELPHKVLNYSGSGDVTARATNLRNPLGCEDADFTGFTVGDIALVQRGTCTLTSKVTKALAAGAAGVIVYNNVPGTLYPSLTVDAPQEIPAVIVTQELGQRLVQLASGGTLYLHVQAETERTTKTTHNIIAESSTGDTNYVTMVGAHLDSVREGAGSNDNGSGVAAVLETALQMARVLPTNKLRFALWGAEEVGLLGSKFYTENLDDKQKASIGLYLNFDMIASPNYVFYVYGGDGSAGPKAISSPKASAQMVDVLGDFYTRKGQPFKRLILQARSDHQSFADIGIPFAGIFTGAEEIKTEQDVALWGGRAGVALDPCYHNACDNYENNADFALDINIDAVAYSTLHFAMNKVTK